MRDEPAGTAGYPWHTQSPDYKDIGDGNDDMPIEALISYLDMADGAAEDPDIPADVRHHCERAARALRAEIALRQESAA